MLPIPLQLIDGFLLKLNLGDVLVIGFALGVLGVLPLKSRKMLALHTISFGLLFMLVPNSLFEVSELSLLAEPLQYKLLGLVLIVISPVLFATAEK